MSEPMRIFGLLPFRGLDDPKSRLGAILTAGERSELALDLLRQAISAMLDGGVEHGREPQHPRQMRIFFGDPLQLRMRDDADAAVRYRADVVID